MLLVHNGSVVCPDRIVEDGAVVIDGRVISAVGSAQGLLNKYPNADKIDAAGGLVMPGLINSHMHFYSTFARGMGLKDFAPANFVEILKGLWWRLDKKLKLDDIYVSALIPIIECIKSGTTTIIDHHASPFAVEGSLDEIERAVDKAGLRASLCYEVSDRDGDEVAKAGISENIRFIKRHLGDERVVGLMGLHASFTLRDETLMRAVAEAKSAGVGCHIHTAEDKADVADARDRYGMGVVERLYHRGVLGEKSIAAHCVHINDREIDLLAETGTNVVHNPESNMNNAVGCAPIIKMFKKGVTVGLGTDGMTSDMFRESKVANILQKHASGDPKVGFVEATTMLMEGNGIICSKLFPKRVGVIEPGAYADIIVLDYKAPTPLNKSNFAGHLLFGLSAGDVVTTICDGRVLMKDRRLVSIDENEVAMRSRELAEKLWERI